MGFGALFLGIMFLYDAPIFLAHSSSEAAYIALDIFPDAIGWILFFFGIFTLSKKADGFEKLRFFPFFMLGLSVLSLLKETLFFSSFYTVAEKSVQQSFAGVAFDVCLRALEMGFLVLLFFKTAKVCRAKKEHKIASAHEMSARVAIVEAVLYVISSLFSAFGLLPSLTPVLLMLENLFMVFLVWFGAISMVRAMLRVSE